MSQFPGLEAPTLVDGTVPHAPLAQQGFSALVEVCKGSQVRRLLFDTGITPDGSTGNLRRLGKDPAGFEAIVCSHGHFDHPFLAARLRLPWLPVNALGHGAAVPGGDLGQLRLAELGLADGAGRDGLRVGPDEPRAQARPGQYDVGESSAG